MRSVNIKTYYEQVSDEETDGNEILPEVTLPPLPAAHAPALERLIGWGKERKDLADLMAHAEAGNPGADNAMHTLKRMFPVKNSTRRVKVPKELVDAHAGGKIEDLRFGVQDIHSQDQWDLLENKVEHARKYFPDIALYEMVDNATGKKTALVMGVEAAAFNAVIKAEQKKQQLNVAVNQACKELNVPQAWVDRKVAAADNAKPAPAKAPPPLPRKSASKRIG